jgi:hypothetical protein
LTIVDGTENGSVTFDLGFSGSLSASQSSLTFSFRDGATKALSVNGTDYTVALAVPSSIPGEIHATITTGADPPGDGPGVPPDGGGGPVNNAPEPSGILLAVLGVAGAVLARSQKWLRKGAWTSSRGPVDNGPLLS